MPRTVESIVENHKAAAALRAAGKPVWSRSINIKSILSEDQGNESPEHVAKVANSIAKLIRSRLPATMLDWKSDECDFDFLDAIESMEECTVKSLAEDKANGVEAVEMLNGWLDQIYDWADANRVWLGI